MIEAGGDTVKTRTPGERTAAAPLVEPTLDELLVRSLLEEIPDALLIVDEDGLIRLVNHALEEMFGYDRAELLGQPVEVLIAESLRARHRAHRLRYRAAPHRRPMGQGLELEGRHRDGSSVPVEISLSPLTTSDGTLTIGTIRDVTERRQVEAANRWIQRLLDATSEALYVFEPDTLRLVHVNGGSCRQTGYGRDELVGMTPLHLLPQLPERRLRSLLEPLLDLSLPQIELETVVRRADGVDVDVALVAELVHPDGAARPVVVASARDVSERVAAERDLAAAQQLLAVVDERERIARDLHDTVVQRMFATGLSLQTASALVPAGPVQDRIRHAVDDVDAAIREVRTSIFSLHGTMKATTSGLRDGVLDQVAESRRVLGFAPSIEFRGAIDTAADPKVTEALLATLREALSNVVRHAEATSVRIEVSVDDRFVLVVRDDGRGPGAGSHHGGNGVGNMADRARELGGDATLLPVEPSGTELRWWVPRP